MPCSETEIVKAARRSHRCSWCAERIEVGSCYCRYRWYDGREASTVKMHPKCYNAIQDVASEEGGELEFCPGEYDRPSTETKQPD